MTDEKGYIQFTCDWRPTDGVVHESLPDLIRWREILCDEGLMGVDANGIGYGNISARIEGSRGFVVTGTQTGHLARVDASHFSLVTSFEVEKNRLSCEGAMRASSESLTHAVLYDADRSVGFRSKSPKSIIRHTFWAFSGYSNGLGDASTAPAAR